MKILFNSKFLPHNPGSFAEGPYRIEAFLSQTEETDRDGEAYITLVHSEAHLESVRDACKNRRMLAEVHLSPLSYEAARSAVGLSVLASEQGDFAVVRPPGHHAKARRADGFCLFNNLAIATQKLVNEGKKVFILDMDGHHGDGTQQIFYRSDQVLFCSIHQLYAYPGTGYSDEKGEGPGKGYTISTGKHFDGFGKSHALMFHQKRKNITAFIASETMKYLLVGAYRKGGGFLLVKRTKAQIILPGLFQNDCF